MNPLIDRFFIVWAITCCYTNLDRTPVLERSIHQGAAVRHKRLLGKTRRIPPLTKKRGLTPEQDEMRLRGLRILARMIVQAHLESLNEKTVEEESGADGLGDAPDAGPHWKDGEHVG